MRDYFPTYYLPAIDAATQAYREVERPWREILGAFDDSDEQHPTPTIYTVYPFLFLDGFQSLTPKDIVPLATASRLLAHSVFAFDAVVDQECEGHDVAGNTLRGEAMRFEAYRILHRLFPPDAQVWRRVVGYLRAESDAIYRERRYASGDLPWHDYDEREALSIIVGKTRLACVVVAGLAELHGDDRLVAPLEESIAHYYVARQMWDDLCDWKRDARAGAPSLLVRRLIPHRPATPREIPLEDLARALYYDDHAEHVLELALSHVDRAAALPDELPAASPWRRVVEALRATLDDLRSDLDAIARIHRSGTVERPVVQVAVPARHGPAADAVRAATRGLLTHWQRGFGEASHAVRCGMPGGRSAYLRSDTYARGILLETLADLRAWGASGLDDLIAYEAHRLIGARDRHQGQWRYFPDRDEPVSDTDTVAQALLAVTRAGAAGALDGIDEAPIAAIDPAALVGSDQPIAVIAHVYHALALFGGAAFRDAVERGIAFVERAQQPGGGWRGDTYCDAPLTMLRCVNLLAAARPSSPALQTAAAHVAASQRPDGDWGVSDGAASDPLSTALAMLALAAAARDGDAAALQAGAAALRRMQRPDGMWPAYPLLSVRVDGNRVAYASRCITTAFALRAAIAADRAAGAWTATEQMREASP